MFFGGLIIGESIQSSNIYGEKCLREYRGNPESARKYVEGKRRISRWFLDNFIVGDTDRYHAAKKVLEESFR